MGPHPDNGWWAVAGELDVGPVKAYMYWALAVCHSNSYSCKWTIESWPLEDHYSYLSFLFRFIPRLSSFSKLQTSLGEILSAPAILAVFLFLRKRQMFSKKIINLSPPHLKFFEEIPRFLSHLVKTCRSWERKLAMNSGEEIWKSELQFILPLKIYIPALFFCPSCCRDLSIRYQLNTRPVIQLCNLYPTGLCRWPCPAQTFSP